MLLSILFVALVLCNFIHFSALTGCLLLCVPCIPQALIMAFPVPSLLHDFSLHCSLPRPLNISLLTVSRENLINFMLLLHQTMSGLWARWLTLVQSAGMAQNTIALWAGSNSRPVPLEKGLKSRFNDWYGWHEVQFGDFTPKLNLQFST